MALFGALVYALGVTGGIIFLGLLGWMFFDKWRAGR